MLRSISVFLFVLALSGCDKSVENANNTCGEAALRYTGGTKESNCDLCCRVEMNKSNVSGEGTVNNGRCVCSKKK